MKACLQYNQMFCSRDYQLTSRFNQQNEKSTSNYITRDWERLWLKALDYRNHRIFTLRCLHKDLVSVSIKLKSTLKTVRAKKIVRKAEKDLIQARIKDINSILDNVGKQTELYRSKLASIISTERLRECHGFVDKVGEIRFNKVKQRQINKFQNLVNKKEGNITRFSNNNSPQAGNNLAASRQAGTNLLSGEGSNTPQASPLLSPREGDGPRASQVGLGTHLPSGEGSNSSPQASAHLPPGEGSRSSQAIAHLPPGEGSNSPQATALLPPREGSGSPPAGSQAGLGTHLPSGEGSNSSPQASAHLPPGEGSSSSQAIAHLPPGGRKQHFPGNCSPSSQGRKWFPSSRLSGRLRHSPSLRGRQQLFTSGLCSPSPWGRKQFFPGNCSPSSWGRKQFPPGNCSPSSQGRKWFPSSRLSGRLRHSPSLRGRQQLFTPGLWSPSPREGRSSSQAIAHLPPREGSSTSQATAHLSPGEAGSSSQAIAHLPLREGSNSSQATAHLPPWEVNSSTLAIAHLPPREGSSTSQATAHLPPGEAGSSPQATVHLPLREGSSSFQATTHPSLRKEVVIPRQVNQAIKLGQAGRASGILPGIGYPKLPGGIVLPPRQTALTPRRQTPHLPP